MGERGRFDWMAMPALLTSRWGTALGTKPHLQPPPTLEAVLLVSIRMHVGVPVSSPRLSRPVLISTSSVKAETLRQAKRAHRRRDPGAGFQGPERRAGSPFAARPLLRGLRLLQTAFSGLDHEDHRDTNSYSRCGGMSKGESTDIMSMQPRPIHTCTWFSRQNDSLFKEPLQ
ncbi:hypothetical protein CDD80_4736 [Ophiocordyceps camponoti-rufipedis]|uniref:Uncharacterized protein n=1 Tax=Ophiocordyceps camponoti-rufipedis TaxID=2004952 RepID=A0A2C5YTQ1_9HYPO|nr:hypothetical protein CDD80_4736 [Ophiocordyceps camponoti-rufipedis]